MQWSDRVLTILLSIKGFLSNATRVLTFKEVIEVRVTKAIVNFDGNVTIRRNLLFQISPLDFFLRFLNNKNEYKRRIKKTN